MAQVFRVGDRSPRVAEARVTLARLGLMKNYRGFALTGAGESQKFQEEDTFFDAALADVVRAFQQSRGILPSGIIDDVTLRELRGASYTLGARDLYLDEASPLVGDDVAQLQQQLQELGFHSSRIDGQFGPETYEALRTYQLNCGLDADGVCGRETLRALSLLGRRIKGGSAQAIRERESVRLAGPQLAGKTIVIDPNLGGDNHGDTVRGRFGDITEEEIIWDLATRLEEQLTAIGAEAILSRPRNTNPTIKERADTANAARADVVISLHCDRYRNEKANGVATFYFGTENAASSLPGEKLSGFVQREIVARTDLTNCGNHRRTWEILRLTRMPTIEVILGYLSNPHDVAILTDPTTRDAIAEAIVVGVKRLYLLDDDTQPTGTYRFSELLADETRAQARR